MLIDLFTLAAQIVNFVVLVWLLKRFLWGKVVKAIDERETRIAARLADADRKAAEADRRTKELDASAAELAVQRTELLNRARQEADELRLAMTREAQEAVRKQEAEWQQDVQHAQTTFLRDVRQRVGAQIMAIVRRALADLACADVQHCAGEVFIDRLRTIEEGSLRELAADGPISVRSATDLPEATRQRIAAVLAERLGRPVALDFVRDVAMHWGLELRSNGRCIGWNPDSYLDSLDEGLRKALESRHGVLVG